MTRLLPLAVLAAALSIGVHAQTGNDLLIGGFSTVDLCLNDGDGTYACAPVSGGGAQPRDFAVADFNGDRLDDFANANGNSNPNRVCLADGAGGFDCEDVFPAQLNYTGVDTADFDGADGPDLVFSYANGPAALCLNDGAGQFSCSDVNAQFTDDVAAADLDGVNGPDLVFATLNFYITCFNDGAGGFPSCRGGSLPSAGDLSSVAVGDLDGVNGTDFILAASILFSGDRGNNLACFNDGAGTFACEDISADRNGSYGAAIGDLDGVNGPDLLFTNSDAPTQLCLNDGSGSFTCGDTDGGEGFFTKVAVGDVDGQTGLDYAVGSNTAAPTSACANDGSGSFSCSAAPVRGSIVQFGEFGGADTPPGSPVEASVSPSQTEVEPGGSVAFSGEVTNTGDTPLDLYAAFVIEGPNGATTRRNIGNGTLRAGASVNLDRFPKSTIVIPTNTPAGVYAVTLVVTVGSQSGEVVVSQSFEITVTDPAPALKGGAALAASAPEAGPNPFRDRTEIRYSLAEAAEVDLRVFDALGREVAALASGTQSEGAHAATFEAGDLPSGVYVWRLAIGGEVTTGRVTLAR